MEQNDLHSRTEAAAQRSRDYHRQGYNCAECVFQTYLDLHPSDLPDGLVRLASGFGGGVGGTGHICGAVSGAVMALGLKKGRDPSSLPTPPERSQQLRGQVYPVFADFIRQVEEEFGSVDCRTLRDKDAVLNGRTKMTSCAQIIQFCSSLVEKFE